MSYVSRNGPAGTLPIEDERHSGADDGDGETHPGTYFRPYSEVPGRRPAEADGTADHEGECRSKDCCTLSHDQTRYRSDDNV
jgi:hypothetical protein